MGLTRRRRSPLGAAVVVIALVATACSANGNSSGSVLPASTETVPASATSGGSIALLTGTVSIDAAQSFEDRGFHQAVEITGTIPTLVSESSSPRATLRVSLWDASRPTQTCSRDHPLSGCVTVDWSDAPGRPHVPNDGVFANQLTLPTTDGTTTFNLRESGELAATPEQFSPG